MKNFFNIYLDKLITDKNILCVNKDDGKRTPRLGCLLLFQEKRFYSKKLRKIESNQVHFRNDKYSIFKG